MRLRIGSEKKDKEPKCCKQIRQKTLRVILPLN